MKRGLYVHVPWCRRRCPYCDFYFVVGRAETDAYLRALKRDFEVGPSLSGPFDTLYFGGGTPSALGPQLARAVELCAREVATGAEITVELNPEDVDDELASALASAGVNRASLGVQSFQSDRLALLGRAHDGETAARAFERLVAAGIENVSVDLILGAPGDDEARPFVEVERARSLGAAHVSAYLLTIEAGTPWEKHIASGKRADVDDDHQADAYRALQRATAAAGFVQYEVSSFALPGKESAHNRVYWSQGSYAGLGPSAHSMAHASDGGVVRRENGRELQAWLAGDARADVEVLEPDLAFLEACAFALRDLQRGVDVPALAARHRVGDARAALVLASLARMTGDRLVQDGEVFRVTPEGALFVDGIMREVLSAGDNGSNGRG